MNAPESRNNEATVIAGPGGTTRASLSSSKASEITGQSSDDGVTRVGILPGGTPDSAATATTMESGALAPGTRLLEFEITRVLGQGGFGVVYEARDHALERIVAVKEYMPASLARRQVDGSVAPQSSSKSETFQLGMRSFINEARLLAQFDHPSLLKVYRFWEEKGTAYMVMPLYRGRTLREELARVPEGASEPWLKSIVDRVSQALQVMHSANCYHRDIAPDNILVLEETDLPVVLDFGAARRVISDQSQAVTVILKPGYAPIEQYGDVPGMVQGPWTDVYALSAVLHLAVTGRVPPPSVGRMLSDSYTELVCRDDLRGRYSAEFLRAIDAGLAVKPDARPQSMLEFRRDLGLEAPQTRVTSGSVERSITSAQADVRVASQRGRRTVFMGISVMAAITFFGGTLAWWLLRTDQTASGPPALVRSSEPVTAPAPNASATIAVSPSSNGASAPSSPSAPPARGPVESLAALRAGADPSFEVRAAAASPSMQIGKDRLAFDVKSNRSGYVYAYLLSSGGEMYLLFPNSIDKRNAIKAGSPMQLPRASWPLNAGGPKGKDRFAILVSEFERDYTSVGIQSEGLFPQFPLPVLAALEVTRKGEETPLLGRPACAAGVKCKDLFGVTFFEVDQH